MSTSGRRIFDRGIMGFEGGTEITTCYVCLCMPRELFHQGTATCSDAYSMSRCRMLGIFGAFGFCRCQLRVTFSLLEPRLKIHPYPRHQARHSSPDAGEGAMWGLFQRCGAQLVTVTMPWPGVVWQNFRAFRTFRSNHCVELFQRMAVRWHRDRRGTKSVS